MSIEPDTKDWTWVLDRPCAECGYDVRTVEPRELADAFHDHTRQWFAVLDRPDVAVRRREDRWSDLEYACHVRDVHKVFAERVRMMLDLNDPAFPNWDQDETARIGNYAEQDPHQVVLELAEAAADVAACYATVPANAWTRAGLRSDGSAFSVASLGRYHLHDVVHHLSDVGAR